MKRTLLAMLSAASLMLGLAACENTGEGLQEDLEQNVDQVEEETGDDG